MASIRKRSNGKYQATIYLGRDKNGKQLFKYITRSTLKECKCDARILEKEIIAEKNLLKENYHNNNRVNLILINCVTNGINHQMYYKKTPDEFERAIRDLEILFKSEVN